MDNAFKLRDITEEKVNAISRHRRIQKIASLFRVFELLVFLIIISTCSSQLAFNLKLSSDHFERISTTLIRPRFVFLFCNVIVIILFLNSYSKNSRKDEDFYEEYVEKCRNSNNNLQEKHTIIPSCDHDRQRKISRSQSDQNMTQTLRAAHDRKDLRRTMTGKCKKSIHNKPVMPENSMLKEEEMSNEEFRRTVEAFIARQQRFLREE